MGCIWIRGYVCYESLLDFQKNDVQKWSQHLVSSIRSVKSLKLSHRRFIIIIIIKNALTILDSVFYRNVKYCDRISYSLSSYLNNCRFWWVVQFLENDIHIYIISVMNALHMSDFTLFWEEEKWTSVFVAHLVHEFHLSAFLWKLRPLFWDQGKFLEDKYISPLVLCIALAKTARQYWLWVAFKND